MPSSLIRVRTGEACGGIPLIINICLLSSIVPSISAAPSGPAMLYADLLELPLASFLHHSKIKIKTMASWDLEAFYSSSTAGVSTKSRRLYEKNEKNALRAPTDRYPRS